MTIEGRIGEGGGRLTGLSGILGVIKTTGGFGEITVLLGIIGRISVDVKKMAGFGVESI